MSGVEPSPSATVVPLREGVSGPEVLLVRRSPRLNFHGGAWVFPGGRIDDVDRAGARPGDVVQTARNAAVREAREEAGLHLSEAALVLVSCWTTPEGFPRRYRTWFFLARADGQAVSVDGSEIDDHRWLTPRTALEDQAAGELALPPPTFVTLTRLSEHGSAQAALHFHEALPPEIFEPRPQLLEEGWCSLYEPDAGYADGNLSRPGPRHRLWAAPSGWHYERSF